MILTEQETSDYLELLRLHDVAFRDYLERHNYGHKSSEGCVSLHFGNFWEREGWDTPGASKLVGVEVYSYALGPSRSHWFNSMAEALENVRRWHDEQLAKSDDY